MSYKPLKEMTDKELAVEQEVWDCATRRSQIRSWALSADRWRNKVLGEQLGRRRSAEGRADG